MTDHDEYCDCDDCEHQADERHQLEQARDRAERVGQAATDVSEAARRLQDVMSEALAYDTAVPNPRPSNLVEWILGRINDSLRLLIKTRGEVIELTDRMDGIHWDATEVTTEPQRGIDMEAGRPAGPPCGQCGEPMETRQGAGRQRRYCSDRCRQAAYRSSAGRAVGGRVVPHRRIM